MCTHNVLEVTRFMNDPLQLTIEQKRFLLTLARKTLEIYLRDGVLLKVKEVEPVFLEKRGTFVSLHQEGRLRGCIGFIKPEKPIYESIQEMALASALKDPRFLPLSFEELMRVEIEISILSLLRRVSDITEIKVGRDGLYLVKGLNSGLLLPQVAAENKWDETRFLTETCRKAGLSAHDWREGAEIYRFSALVFSETELFKPLEGS